MTKEIDILEIELENDDVAYDPNGTLDGFKLLDFMNEKCTTYPDLCDHLALCPCEEDWHSGDDGTAALELMIKDAGELNTDERSVTRTLFNVFTKLSELNASYRFKIATTNVD